MTAARPGSSRAIVLAATLLAVGLIVAAVHSPVLRAQARSFDDTQFVTYNPLVTHPSWQSVGRFFSEVLQPSTVRGYYLPVSMTSLMLDYALGGRADNLLAFHRTSLALHVLNTILIVLILLRLFGALVPAALAGLMFGLHPLTVEPTAWIGERKTLLAAFFALSSLLAYLRHVQAPNRRAWRLTSLALYLLALLSKPTVTMLPVLLVLLDYWPLRRPFVKALVEKWPFLLLSTASAVVTLLSHYRTAGIATSTRMDVLRWPLHAAYLLAFYLRKIVWPADLSCAYQPPAPLTLLNPAVLPGVIGVCALTVLLAAVARRQRGPLAGWLFFVAAIAPTLGLVQYSWVIAADKYVYFPALGILMPLAAGLAAAWRARRAEGVGPGLLLLLSLSLLAAEARGVRATLRNWTDSLTLCRHMEKIAPDAPAVQNQLGVVLAERSENEEALGHLRRATVLVPDYAEAQYNLGYVLAMQGLNRESIPHLQKAAELLPQDPETASVLGTSLYRAGRLDEAEAELRRALRLDPNHVQALDQLGGVLLVRGHVAEGVELIQRAVDLAPGEAVLHFRLASSLGLLGGRAPEVATHLREAMRLEPTWAEPFNALAWIRSTSPDAAERDSAEALGCARRAVELTQGKDPKVFDTMAAALAEAGRFDEAAGWELRALAAGDTLEPRLAGDFGARLQLYKRGLAYREPRPATRSDP